MAMLASKPMGLSKASAPVARAGFSRTPKLNVAAKAAATKGKAGSKAAYVCLECGYIYDGAVPFEDVKNYACPVCAAPKRRFKELRGNNLRNNDPKSMQTRKAKLREQVEADGGNPDEGGNELLLVTGALIAAGLGYLAYSNLS